MISIYEKNTKVKISFKYTFKNKYMDQTGNMLPAVEEKGVAFSTSQGRYVRVPK